VPDSLTPTIPDPLGSGVRVSQPWVLPGLYRGEGCSGPAMLAVCTGPNRTEQPLAIPTGGSRSGHAVFALRVRGHPVPAPADRDMIK